MYVDLRVAQDSARPCIATFKVNHVYYFHSFAKKVFNTHLSFHVVLLYNTDFPTQPIKPLTFLSSVPSVRENFILHLKPSA
jgi:hypothetical protein